MYMRWARRLPLAAAVIVSSSATIMAQEVQLEGVVVTTSKTPTRAVDSPSPSSSVGGSSSPAPAVFTAPVTGDSESAFSAESVSGTGELDLIQPQSVADAIRDIPGVATQINPNDPAQAINIRGLQDFGRVAVTVDGARQNFQRSGHNADGFFYLDPEFLSRVDVTRGPTATVFGSGAIGGVAAFTTRDVEDVLTPNEIMAFEQKTAVGTNGIGYVSSSSAAMRVGKNVDLYGQFVGRKTYNYEDGNDDIIPDSEYRDYGGLAKFAVRPAAGHEITGSALLQRYQFINGTAFSTDDPRRDNDLQADTYTLGYTFARPDTPLLDFSAKAYFTTTVQDQAEIGTSNPLETRNFDIETTGFDVFNTSRFSTAMLGHRLTYGIDGFQDQVKVTDEFGTGDLFTPNGERTVFGGFIEDEVRITSWMRVIGALRYDTYDLSGGGESSDGSHLSPKATVAVKPVEGIEVYGTYAEAYRAPAVTETLVAGTHPPFFTGAFDAFTFVPNPDLNPEVGQNKEIGVNLSYNNVLTRGDKFRGKVSAYRNDVSDYIEFVEFGPPLVICPFPDPDCTIPYTFVQYQNVANAQIEGVEAEFDYDWGDGFFHFSATHTRGENSDTGEALNSIPPDRISTTIGWRFMDKKLVAGTRVLMVDSTDDDIDESLQADGYAVVDVFASYQVTNDIVLDGILYNVFDKQYQPFLNADSAAGIQGKVALTVKFPVEAPLGGY